MVCCPRGLCKLIQLIYAYIGGRGNGISCEALVAYIGGLGVWECVQARAYKPLLGYGARRSVNVNAYQRYRAGDMMA